MRTWAHGRRWPRGRTGARGRGGGARAGGGPAGGGGGRGPGEARGTGGGGGGGGGGARRRGGGGAGGGAGGEHRDPDNTTAGDVASRELVTVTPDDGLDNVVRLMREHAVRRLPVVEQGHPVGMVTLGDMAMERDERSALADISAEPPNE